MEASTLAEDTFSTLERRNNHRWTELPTDELRCQEAICACRAP